ncbi:MAG: S8 family serine peptidase, partial [Candidatus Krumholzibacteria bacterium]|nr:S8 family serine peptidase [Candidatus Krumholzibacteria bacterium]
MKRVGVFLFFSLAVSSTGVFAQTVADVDPNIYVTNSAAGTLVGYVQDEFIVVLKDGVAIDKTSDAKTAVALSGVSGFSALASTYRVEKLSQQFPGSDRGRAVLSTAGRRLARHYKVKFAQGTLEEAMAAYAANPNVDHVEPIGIHVMYATPNDASYSVQWHLNQTSDYDIDAPEAWNIETGDTSIVVAIMDTGVRYYHKDLGGVNASYTNKTAARGNMWINWAEKHGTASVDDDGNGYVDDWIGYDFVTGVTGCWTGEDCSTKDNDPADFNGHGTHCAGNVGAITNNGYATCAASGGWGSGSNTVFGNGVKVMACRIGYSGDNGGTETGYVRMDFAAEAFYYAADNGARIASCSWGSSNTGGIAAAVTYFLNEGGLVFKAAGNDGTTTADYLCSRLDVISVAATDQTDCKASWSNYGTWVDISAPGVAIYSLYHSHANPSADYIASISGTSMATPIAASVAALIWSKNPTWIAAEVEAQLYETADNIDALTCNASYAGKLGAGRVNAFNAVNTLSVVVGSPDGGEVWSVGEAQDILWSTSGEDPDSISIYLSIDGGANFAYTIAHGLAGSTILYDWTVPELPVTTARIRVVAYAAGESAYDDSDANFTIDGGPYHYVRNGGGNVSPYTTTFWAAQEIQDAVDAAVDGDTILVAGGTYASGVTVDKAVYLLGGWDTTFTTRDPATYPATIQGAGSGVSFMNISSELCGIEGFTLTQGTGTSAAIPASGTYGGGIYSYQSSPTIRNNRIVESGYADETTFSAGGGIACSGGTPVIEHNVLESCAAQSGGGIYLYDTDAILSYNSITGSSPNSSYTGDKVGGGIYSYNAIASLDNNRIRDNDGYGKGGGIYAYLGTTSLSRDTISANDCDVAGGGIYSERAYLVASHALILENTCSGGGGGGGMYFRAEHINFKNSIVALNECGGGGGGI